MGVWDYISGTTDSLKRNAPDLTSVKSWCSGSYGHGKDAVTNIHNAVKVNAGEVLSRYWPSEETRIKIRPFATNVAKYSVLEGLKSIPGGGVALNVVKKSLHDVNKSDHQAVDVKALHAKVDKLEEENGQIRKLLEQMKMENKQCCDIKPSKKSDSDTKSVVNQKPENVIGVFMMEDFMGMQLVNDLLFPGASPRKRQ